MMLARRQFLRWLLAVASVPVVRWADGFGGAGDRDGRERMRASRRADRRYLARGARGAWGIATVSPDPSTGGAAQGRLGSSRGVLGITMGQGSGSAALVDVDGILAVQRLG